MTVGNEVRANKRIHLVGPREPWAKIVLLQHASPQVVRGGYAARSRRCWAQEMDVDPARVATGGEGPAERNR